MGWIQELKDAENRPLPKIPPIWRRLQGQIESDLSEYTKLYHSASTKVLNFKRDDECCKIMLQTAKGQVAFEIGVELTCALKDYSTWTIRAGCTKDYEYTPWIFLNDTWQITSHRGNEPALYDSHSIVQRSPEEISESILRPWLFGA